MTNPISSPFAAKPEEAAPAIDPQLLAAATAAARAQIQSQAAAASSNAIFGTFRYEMHLSLLKGQLAKIGTIIESGLQEEDLSVDTDEATGSQTIDTEFEHAAIEALEEIEGEARKLLATALKFKNFIVARSQG